MSLTVENICGFLIRSRLMTAEEMRQMYQRWQGQAKNAAGDLNQFSRWLVSNNYATDYQINLLLKGHTESFYLNQYRIMERIGKGRMAGVYKAVHPLGQVVALKVLPPSKAKHPTLLGRFQREARLAMKLKHPNVVRTFQVGEAEGLQYIVMEHLEGETLDEVFRRRGKLPPNEAVRIVYQALNGLQHIHEQNMVHRDLKPANMMLVSSASGHDEESTLRTTLKILDIGLGREFFDENAKETAPAGDIELTTEGVLLGTPDYLSPEQARDPRSIDIRSDIYSLGCVLYHALAGHPPFPDKNLLQQMVRHATEAPRPIRELNAAAPDGLQQVLNWMLAKKPEERYPTPERVAQALKMFMVAEGAPVTRLEDQPNMRKYLTWLETGGNGQDASPALAAPALAPAAAQPIKRESEPPAPAAAPPVAARSDSRQVPVKAAPAAQPVPAPKESKGGKHKKKKKHAAPAAVLVSRPHAPPPAATPAGPAPGQVASLADVDVELVPLEQLKAPSGKGLGRRDWILLGAGAAAVIAAGVIGIIVKLIIGWWSG